MQQEGAELKTSGAALKRFLILNPFVYEGRNPNLMVDPVLRRHAGQEVKTGLTYPLGLGYIAAALLDAGCDVCMLDPMAERVSAARIHRESARADAIVVPYSFPHADAIARFFGAFPGKVRIACGPIAEVLWEDVLRERNADVVLIGEPEQTVVELAQAYPDVSAVRGLAHRMADGGAVKTAPRPSCQDLNALPFPHRAYGNPRVYWDVPFFGRPTAWVLPSRGCPYDCLFCSQGSPSGDGLRRRDAANVVDELERVGVEFGIRCFSFSDDTFNFDPSYVHAVCEEILRRGLRIEWHGTARADRVRPEMLAHMRRAGCVELQFGLESADDEILRYLGKRMTVEQIRQGVARTREAGINVSLHCIFGSPMESPETIRKTMAFLREVRPLFVAFNVLTPLPGSPLFEQVRARIGARESMATFDILHTKYSLCRYTPEELQGIVRKAYRDYYLSPRFAGRLIEECCKRPEIVVRALTKAIPRQAAYLYRSLYRR